MSFWPCVSAALLLPLSALTAPATPLTVELNKDVSLELVEIAPGSFQQGSPDKEPGRHPDEASRSVRLTKKFYLGKYPVTRGQYAAFAAATGYKTEAESGPSGGFGWDGAALVQKKEYTWRSPGFPQTDKDPVILVTYSDAQAFLGWLSSQAHRRFELPSEAQWEYAARAGSATAWQNGNDAGKADAVSWNKANAGQGTKPVGGRPLNAWGLGDMAGNVWQWCEDWYGPYAAGAQTDPVQTNPNLSEKPRRVLRGGSWLRDRLDCRSAARYRNDARSRNADNGFRVMTFAAAAEPGQKSAQVLASRREPVKADLGWFALVAVFFIAIVGMRVIRAVIGSLSSSGGSSSFGGKIVRAVEDGFWIAPGAFPRGERLVCQYNAIGDARMIEIVFEPGRDGQFVYTGQRPYNIRIQMLGAQQDRGVFYDSNVSQDDGPIVQNVSPPMPPPDREPEREARPESGPPPAY